MSKLKYFLFYFILIVPVWADKDSEKNLISVRIAPSNYNSQKNKITFEIEHLNRLARAGKPEIFKLGETIDIMPIFREKYGRAVEDMWPILNEFNPVLLRGINEPPETLYASQSITEILIPPGPLVEEVDVPIQETDSISRVAYANLGSTNSNILDEVCKRYYDAENDQLPKLNCNKINEGTSINLVINKSITVEAKSDSLEKTKESLGEEFLKNSSVNIAPGWRIPSLSSLASSDDCSVESNIKSSFKVPLIEEILRNNNSLRRNIQSEEVLVAVADSGISRDELSLNRFSFAQSTFFRESNISIGLDLSRTIPDRFPLALGTRGSKELNHGTHVAGILNGLNFESDYLKNFIDKYMKIVIFKINDKSKDIILDDAISDVLDLARINQISVVNMSIESQNHSGAFRGLDKTPNTLFVFSSGNKGFRDSSITDNQQQWPLMYGGEKTQNVIVVGSHNIDIPNKPWPNSNTSKKYVDLAAPGVCIRSLSVDSNRPMTLTGTSQAAPLVSFVASILFSYDIRGRNKAHWTKYRLISGVDFQLELYDHYYSSGNLNIEKTLRLFEDIIEINGTIHSGVILTKTISDSTLDRKNHQISSLMKIKPFRAQNKANYLRLVEGKSIGYNDISYSVTDVTADLEQEIVFFDSSGEKHIYRLGEIDDIVLTEDRFRIKYHYSICKNINFQHDSCAKFQKVKP